MMKKNFVNEAGFLHRSWQTCMVAAIAVSLAACSQIGVSETPGVSGVYSGVAPDGRDLVIRVFQRQGFLYGWGQFNRDEFGFAAFGPSGGEAIVAFEDGSRQGGELAISAAGIDLSLDRDGDLALERRSDVSVAPGGVFTGVYRTRDEVQLDLTVAQWEDVLGGYGVFDGQEVALAGKASGSGSASCVLLFSDSSRVRAEIERTSTGNLKVSGLGARIELSRRSREIGP